MIGVLVGLLLFLGFEIFNRKVMASRKKESDILIDNFMMDLQEESNRLKKEYGFHA